MSGNQSNQEFLRSFLHAVIFHSRCAIDADEDIIEKKVELFV
jgi:hypothetical protein